MLAGLLLFGLGFAVAALISLTTWGGRPAYLTSIALGFVGVGVVAFFLNRGTVPLPEAPIWSRVGLRALARALDLPAMVVMAVVYGLIVLGIVGNVLIPLSTR